MLNDYPESQQEASSNLRLVLQMMGQHQITPHPRNYALCYEYVLARNPSLNRALDSHFAHNAELSEEVSISLYDEFIAHGSMSTMNRAQEELKRVLRSVMLQLLQTGNEFAQYANGLGSQLERMKDTSNIDLVREIGMVLVEDTRHMESTSKATTARLTGATEEVDRLRKELDDARREASTDPLTGLLNRRAFTTVISNAIAKSSADQQPFSLLLLDIDHFKSINDTYGHLVGDKVLRFIGRLLAQVLKGQDTVCRFGGEEFAALLPDTRLQGAEHVAETIRNRLMNSQLRLTESGQSLGEITASFGIALYQPGETIEELIHRTDRALYEAKHAGRNRVNTAS